MQRAATLAFRGAARVSERHEAAGYPRAARLALWRSPTAMLGAVILGLLVTAAALAPWIAPHDPLAINVGNALAGASGQHLLGTDHLGRDTLSRLLYGSRASLGAAGAVVALVTAVGIAVGTAAGFYGGWVDELAMRLVDILLALPSFILALVVAGMLGPGLQNVVLAMVLVRWAGFARVVRSLVLSLREQPYVEAARSLGANDRRIMARHLLPNVVGPVVVLATLDLGSAILGICGLSFIGLGVPLPHAEWGSMLNYARVYIQKAPLLMVYPGACISLAVLSANLLGDGLRDVLDPQSAHPPQ
ncbi:MAG: ABC transporter permease [Chloroflexi bacterium]|nr:ABC transporter permease [Chloroflexota bacterium]